MHTPSRRLNNLSDPTESTAENQQSHEEEMKIDIADGNNNGAIEILEDKIILHTASSLKLLTKRIRNKEPIITSFLKKSKGLSLVINFTDKNDVNMRDLTHMNMEVFYKSLKDYITNTVTFILYGLRAGIPVLKLLTTAMENLQHVQCFEVALDEEFYREEGCIHIINNVIKRMSITEMKTWRPLYKLKEHQQLTVNPEEVKYTESTFDIDELLASGRRRTLTITASDATVVRNGSIGHWGDEMKINIKFDGKEVGILNDSNEFFKYLQILELGSEPGVKLTDGFLRGIMLGLKRLESLREMKLDLCSQENLTETGIMYVRTGIWDQAMKGDFELTVCMTNTDLLNVLKVKEIFECLPLKKFEIIHEEKLMQEVKGMDKIK